MTRTQDGKFGDMTFFQVLKKGNADEIKMPYKDPDFWGAPPPKLKKRLKTEGLIVYLKL